MLYSEMLRELRTITTGIDKCSDSLKEILEQQKCLYLMSKIQDCAEENSSFLKLNQVVQNYRYKFCEDIFNELNELSYAVIKGALLSERIYSKPYFRVSGDIDILISSKNIERVTQILKKNGFVQGKIRDAELENCTRQELVYYKMYTHQLASFFKKTDFTYCPFINIDVNLGIFWGESDRVIDMDEFLSSLEKRTVYGVDVLGLSPVHEFIALCLHHYKDLNSIYLLAEKGIDLSMFVDIFYYLIKVCPDIDELNENAEKYRVKEYIYYCIFWTNEIFQHPLLRRYLSKLENPQVFTILDYYGLTASERTKWNIPFPARVFDKDFCAYFRKDLKEDDIRKIEINRYYI